MYGNDLATRLVVMTNDIFLNLRNADIIELLSSY